MSRPWVPLFWLYVGRMLALALNVVWWARIYIATNNTSDFGVWQMLVIVSLPAVLAIILCAALTRKLSRTASMWVCGLAGPAASVLVSWAVLGGTFVQVLAALTILWVVPLAMLSGLLYGFLVHPTTQPVGPLPVEPSVR